ncbi:protein quick-to-court [Halyomorpha halys]|uniref:protein quick-to-court n=1 Tax=Halyomorpha halys TaxID=286706 RepID=UPI0006D517FE|nr:uncharacterized protein LOC106677849 isoform X2 [Halyomorpha halys]
MSKLTKRRDSTGSDASLSSRIPISFTPTLPRKQRSNLSRHQSLHSIRNSRSDDVDSICSGSSSICEHSHFAKNGSTYSGRSKRYIVHCSPQPPDSEEYLTPTQRANATIRKLKCMLSDAQSEVASRDEEIARLTRELVQLRLGNVESSGHGDEVDSPERKNLVPERMSPHSLSDSGHFEELSPEPMSKLQLSPFQASSSSVEVLIHKLSEANERYYELKPQYEDLKKRLEALELERDQLKAKFQESEENHRKTYLEMFKKGQQAALFQVEENHQPAEESKPEGVPSLLKELEVTKQELESVKDVDFWKKTKLLSGTEAVSIWNLCRKTMYRKLLESNNSRKEQDAEITLKFLKSAFYYFLTDRENTNGHLAAIQSILGFTPDEKLAIERASYAWK